MQSVAVLLAGALLFVSCSPDSGSADSASSCAAKLYPQFNPKSLNPCVDFFTRCNRGTATTCSTSCTLKGAR
jgi:hypothetical protein